MLKTLTLLSLVIATSVPAMAKEKAVAKFKKLLVCGVYGSEMIEVGANGATHSSKAVYINVQKDMNAAYDLVTQGLKGAGVELVGTDAAEKLAAETLKKSDSDLVAGMQQEVKSRAAAADAQMPAAPQPGAGDLPPGMEEKLAGMPPEARAMVMKQLQGGGAGAAGPGGAMSMADIGQQYANAMPGQVAKVRAAEDAARAPKNAGVAVGADNVKKGGDVSEQTYQLSKLAKFFDSNSETARDVKKNKGFFKVLDESGADGFVIFDFDANATRVGLFPRYFDKDGKPVWSGERAWNSPFNRKPAHAYFKEARNTKEASERITEHLPEAVTKLVDLLYK